MSDYTLLTYQVTEFLDASRGITTPRRGAANASGGWEPDHIKKQMTFKIKIVMQDEDGKQIALKIVAKAVYSTPGLIKSKMEGEDWGMDYGDLLAMAREAYERTTTEIALRAKAGYMRNQQWPDASTLDWFGPGRRMLEMWSN